MKPLVSVVIPAYNAGPFIDASVGSALNQSGAGDLDVIVINDGSTDDTLDRLRSWNDPRLTVITQTNQGLAAALNTGIRASRGAYIGFLDADDVWLPGKLARHVQFHQERPDIDVTFSWVSAIDGCGNPVRIPCPRWRGTVSLPQLLADYMIRTMSAVVIRREAAEQAGSFDSSLVRCVDLEFSSRRPAASEQYLRHSRSADAVPAARYAADARLAADAAGVGSGTRFDPKARAGGDRPSGASRVQQHAPLLCIASL